MFDTVVFITYCYKCRRNKIIGFILPCLQVGIHLTQLCDYVILGCVVIFPCLVTMCLMVCI